MPPQNDMGLDTTFLYLNYYPPDSAHGLARHGDGNVIKLLLGAIFDITFSLEVGDQLIAWVRNPLISHYPTANGILRPKCVFMCALI